MKKIICIFVFALCAVGCSYDAMPPKTVDGDDKLVLPKGEVPSEAEMQAVSAARTEYEQWLEDNS